MSDELDDYSERAERAQDAEDALDDERSLSDADQLTDGAGEGDETPFDETRHTYSGVDEDDADVDVTELDEAGARLDDPEREQPDDGG